jgi:hypothetical protein
MAHFPVALWTTAALIITLRALSDGALAKAFDRVLVPILALGFASGVLTYVLGLLVWPALTLQTTPLGRNHMISATWSLFYWTAVLFLRWWVGERAWEGLTNRIIMLGLGALGTGLLSVTGTLGGHLHGAPSFLSDVLKMLGWDVYGTFYLPSWMLAILALVIVTMPLLAFLSWRAAQARLRAATEQRA